MFWGKFLTGQLKILYTPGKSPAVQNVIKQANETLKMVDHFTSHVEHWLTNTSLVLRDQYNDDKEILQKIDFIDAAGCWWLNLVSQANFSLFVPFDKEYEAVHYAIDTAPRENVTVYATIVFDVEDNATALPRHVNYKIRMNSTYLPSVRRLRPLYWSPSPRSWDMLYYASGFMFLQDTIDRAIIDSHVGYNVVEPGIYNRLTPAPCYLYDIFLFTNTMILPLCMVSFIFINFNFLLI